MFRILDAVLKCAVFVPTQQAVIDHLVNTRIKPTCGSSRICEVTSEYEMGNQTFITIRIETWIGQEETGRWEESAVVVAEKVA